MAASATLSASLQAHLAAARDSGLCADFDIATNDQTGLSRIVLLKPGQAALPVTRPLTEPEIAAWLRHATLVRSENQRDDRIRRINVVVAALNALRDPEDVVLALERAGEDCYASAGNRDAPVRDQAKWAAIAKHLGATGLKVPR